MAGGHEERIEALRGKQKQLGAEIQRLRGQLRADARKADTRRKILIGAVILEEMQSRPDFDAWVRKRLGEFLTKDRDRALFDLPLIESMQDNTPPAEEDAG